MSRDVEIEIDRATLLELLATVEAGDAVILSRDNVPVARMTKIEPRPDINRAEFERAVEAIFEARAGIPPTTIQEILAWRDEGRR